MGSLGHRIRDRVCDRCGTAASLRGQSIMKKATLRERLPVIQSGFWNRQWWLFRRSFVSAYEDGTFGYGKAAAYSALLSFFPVMTSLTAILVQANAGAVSRILTRFLFDVAP